MMNNAGGFITLHRQILEWEWYKDLNTKGLFIHLLLMANFADGRFEGKDVKRGQVVTSLPSLAKQTSLSIQQVRTALAKLKSTGEITDNATRHYRIITICKYNEYQDDNRQNNRQITDNQQTDNRQVTDNQQQYNNNNNNNKGTMEQYNSPSESKARDDPNLFDAFWDLYPKKVAKQVAQKAWKKLKPDSLLFNTIANALEKWKLSEEWQRDGGRFIPHPATWLNGHRWEDEVRKADKAPVQAPVPIRKASADNFSQRDYSTVNDDLMSSLARELEEFRKNGGTL